MQMKQNWLDMRILVRNNLQVYFKIINLTSRTALHRNATERMSNFLLNLCFNANNFKLIKIPTTYLLRVVA